MAKTQKDTTGENSLRKNKELGVLPTRNLMLFPHLIMPIHIGREDSLQTVKRAEQTKEEIIVACQIDPEENNPTLDQLFNVASTAKVLNVLEMPEGHGHTALLQCSKRCSILKEAFVEGYPMAAAIRTLSEISCSAAKFDAYKTIADLIKQKVLDITDISSHDRFDELKFNIKEMTDPDIIVNMVASQFPLENSEKLDLLMISNCFKRAETLLGMMTIQEEKLKVAQKIQENARESFDDQQRRAFLQRQLEAIDMELNGETNEVEQLKKRAAETKLSDKAREVFDREVVKLSRFNPASPDYSVQYTYLDTLLSLPWGVVTEPQTDLTEAVEILDKSHYGLERVKERIVEQVALIVNDPEVKSPIICLVGPPGVGKTSLGQYIAKALGRKFERISLGGLHDEAEIRGHRRTYIGAMPGRIIDAMRRAGSCNPVLMLDEIDKIGKDYKGDPEAALLEVLDPEQNYKFHDNYIDVDFSLANVLFIATANNVSNLSAPLLDRMEVIDIAGYIPDEKVAIAQNHLIAKVKADYNDKGDVMELPDATLNAIIDGYTAESGVRQLEKNIRSLYRKNLVKKLSGKNFNVKINPDDLTSLLGPRKFSRDRYTDNEYAGVVTGLAWTAVGGEILFVETSLSKAKTPKLSLTGNLGDVMKESAMIGLQYIKAHADTLGVDASVIDNSDIHIHVPEGAIPKDGPSAGITIATSLLSALKGVKVKPRVAMTGELTLRGKVLPVGGIKEKILAAKRAGIEEIILCKENRKDIEEIGERYVDGLTFHYVDHVSEVFNLALTNEPAKK